MRTGLTKKQKTTVIYFDEHSRMDIPVSLPFREGMTLPTALAAPVELGMMLPEAARPPRQSFRDTPSTVFWVAVVE